MPNAFFSIKCLTGASAGTEQSLADWGIEGMRIRSVPNAQDMVTFRMVVPAADADPVFNYLDTAAVYFTDTNGNRTRRFVGVWTKSSSTIAGENETIEYELSGTPWYYMSHCPYQAEWSSLVPGASTVDLTTVYKAFLVAGLAPDGSAVDFDSTLIDALNWTIYCGSQQAPVIVPFQLGTVTLGSMFVPQEQLKNVSVAELVVHLLRWAPGCALTVDYSEPTLGAPPTVTVVPRSSLGAVALPMTGGNTTALSSITARKDLLIGGVIIKYDEVSQIDNVSYLQQAIDAYPSGINGLSFQNLITYVDLQGGNKTYESVKITTVECPLSEEDENALPYAKNQQSWIWKQTVPGAFDYDVANITVTKVTTTLDPNDPYATDPPDGFTMAVLTGELITGEIKPWMATDYHIYAAKVQKFFELTYSGTDPKTLLAFSNGQNPNTFVWYQNMKATSASSGTFTHLVSQSAGEAAPEGLAEAVYNQLAMLHYEGTIVLTEDECSGSVKLSNVLNISGGRSEWSTMSAQIMSIEEDIDTAMTTIRFGPPVTLGVEDYMDLLRCWRIPHPPTAASQQGTADASQGDIAGHQHAHHTSHIIPPGQSVQAGPFLITTRANPAGGGSYQMKVSKLGTICKSYSAGDVVAITGLDAWVTMTGNDTVWIEGAVSGQELSGGVTIKNYGSRGTGLDVTKTYWQAGGPTENDGASPPNQTIFRRVLAVFVAGGTGAPTISQVFTGTNLVLAQAAFDGQLALYPFPF